MFQDSDACFDLPKGKRAHQLRISSSTFLCRSLLSSARLWTSEDRFLLLRRSMVQGAPSCFLAQVLTIHYEELVSHFPAVASDLLAHCGLDWEGSVLDFHKVDRAVASASVAQVSAHPIRAADGILDHSAGADGAFDPRILYPR